jgi:hypothetical protein
VADFIHRHWPLTIAFAAWLLLLVAFFQSEIVRAVVAVVCIALMVVQWLIYRKATTGELFAFLSVIAGGFGLANLWLLLNVVRFYTYDADSGSGVHFLVIRIQDALLWVVVAVLAVTCVWALSVVARWLGRNLRTTNVH